MTRETNSVHNCEYKTNNKNGKLCGTISEFVYYEQKSDHIKANQSLYFRKMFLSGKSILIFLLIAMGVLSAPVENENNFLGDDGDCVVKTDEHHIVKRAAKIGPNSVMEIPKVTKEKKWKRVVATGRIRIPIVVKKSDYSQSDLKVFYEGLADIERKTCIRFVNRTNQADYVMVRDGGKNLCSANIGRIGGRQFLTFTPGCMRVKKKCIHEMIHIIGFRHMHQRFDRDKYVKIKWNNIEEKYKTAFRRFDNKWEAYGTKYDMKSCMHYVDNFFSKNNKITIETKDPQYQKKIGNVTTLSDGDATRINRMYNCPAPYK